MKKFNVVLLLIVGYYEEDESPRLKRVEYEVEAESEDEAIVKGKALDTTRLSVYETYADEV